MSLIHDQTVDGRHYQVRSAGQSVRLYTDGVFHSQWNPTRPLDGSLWDLFLMAALPLPTPRRALVLGVGGGAALLRWQTLFPSIQLTGVDIDFMHLQLAEQHFGLRATLHCADAQSFLQRSKRRFDVIVDDLFNGYGTPARAVPLSAEWLTCLTAHLNPGGTLIINSLGRQELQKSALWKDSRFQSEFVSATRWQAEGYENIVSVWSRSRFDPSLADTRLQSLCQLYPLARRALGRHTQKAIRLRA